MKIRTRLQVSNFLMIGVPLGITVATAVFCLALVWMAMSFGGGLGFDDREDFEEVGATVTLAAQQALQADDDDTRLSRLERLSGLLDENAMRLIVERNGERFYAHGDEDAADAALQAAGAALPQDGSISQQSRSLYTRTLDADGDTYRIYLFGSAQAMISDFYKMLLSVAAVILIAAILIALILTNHFLTRFVFRKIEEPLDILAEGVQQIGAGNLDYRIYYEGDDEFAPICDQFNEMAQRLKWSVEESQRQEESRKELMAGISHDLRSPLTAVQAYVEGLLDGVANTPEKQQAYLRTIKTKAEEIQRMVSQIFQYSKMDLENYPLNMEPLQLDSEIAALLEVVAPEYAAKGLEVQSTTLAPLRVNADAELVRRILVNILDNSLKYKTAATGHVTISLDDNGDAACLTLADDGPGVAPEALPKLFDVFYRSDSSRHNPNQGSGLGLAIVAKAVQRMGGQVTAQANTPHGLMIAITLPKGEAQHG